MGLFQRAKEFFEPKELTEIWQLFEAGKKHDNVRALRSTVEQAYRFYEGDQWYGLGVKNANLQPFHNFIAPTVKHKLSNVCMNDMAVVFDGDDDKLCDFLTATVNDIMKKIKMNDAHWKTVRAALITGNGYLFFPTGGICIQGAHIRGERNAWQLVDSTNIFFGDESTSDIQSQPYIIIYERRSVDDVRRIAKENGLEEEAIGNIVCDDDTELVTTTDTKEEVDNHIGKCSCLVYMTIKNGLLHVARSTKYVIYEPEHPIQGENAAVGMDLYPIVGMVVSPMKGSSRGRGEVTPMIPNQIEYNKNLIRMLATVKNTAFPKVVYNSHAVDNPDALDEVGGKISINDNTAAVTQMIGYLQPAGMSGDAQFVSNLLMDTTRELMNAGQAVTGEINPEKASGTAIIAMRDQAAIPLNEIQSAFKQFYADVAMVLFHYLIAYNPLGLNVEKEMFEQEGAVYTVEQLKDLDISVNVEVTSVAPYSIFARDSALEKLFGMQAISFEEYVEALDENSNVPKKILEEVLAVRREVQQAAQAEQAITAAKEKGAEQDILASIAEKKIQESLPPSQEESEAEIMNILQGGEVNG